MSHKGTEFKTVREPSLTLSRRTGEGRGKGFQTFVSFDLFAK
jgi:hypothetical protein